MAQSTPELSGLEKASVLIMSLGAARSAEVMKRLTPGERDLLEAQIVRMRSVKSAAKQRVFEEVNEFMRNSRSAGAETEQDQPEEPLRWMDRLEPDSIALMLAGERPHNVALVLAHLSSGTAAEVVALLDEGVRNQVMHRLAAMRPVSGEVVKAVDGLMRERVGNGGGHLGSRANPGRVLLRALDGATRAARQSVVSAVSRTDSADGGSQMVTISELEDLARLPDAEIAAVVREVDIEDLGLALRVASEWLRSVVLKNATTNKVDALRERINRHVQPKVTEIGAAQRRIMNLVRMMVADGRIGAVIEVGESAGE